MGGGETDYRGLECTVYGLGFRVYSGSSPDWHCCCHDATRGIPQEVCPVVAGTSALTMTTSSSHQYSIYGGGRHLP